MMKPTRRELFKIPFGGKNGLQQKTQLIRETLRWTTAAHRTATGQDDTENWVDAFIIFNVSKG